MTDGTEFYVVDERDREIVGGPYPSRVDAKADDEIDDPDTIIMSDRALDLARSERPIRDTTDDVDVITDGGSPVGPDPSRAHHPEATPEPNPKAHREAYMGPHSHLCELCEQTFDDLDDLADHECQPVRADGGQSTSDIERAFVDEDEPEETDDSNDRPVGPLLYTEDGTPVRVRAMDEKGEFLTYQGSPEQGFYVFEGSGEQATIALDPDHSVEAGTDRGQTDEVIDDA
jgi:hypothetical protein